MPELNFEQLIKKNNTTDDEKQIDLIEESFKLLFPNRQYSYNGQIVYTGRLKDFGANVEFNPYNMNLIFKLSRRWFKISKEIKIGLLQELMLKLFKPKFKTKADKKKINTMYIDIYNSFIKNLHIAIPKKKTHPILEGAFNRVNEIFFLGLVEKPNLEWGRESTTKLGSYDFKTDTISMSKIFLNNKDEKTQKFLDYIMYHELLHKVKKFKANLGKTVYHDKKFRKAEEIFDNGVDMEKELERFLKRIKRPKFWLF